MRGIRSLVAVALVLSVGCGGKAAPPPEAPSARAEVPVEETAPPLVVEVDALPEIPADPQPAPTELMATATVGDPQGWFGALRAYADAVRPGVGTLLAMSPLVDQLAGFGIDLHGADLSQPIRVLALDPTLHPMPLVVVVAVADETMLRKSADELGMAMIVHGALAALGARDALRTVAPYALTTAVATAVPRDLTATIDLAAAITRFRPMAEAWLDGAMRSGTLSGGSTARVQVQSVLDLLGQFEHMTITMTGDRDRITVTTTLTPRADESLAQFIAQQRPAQFALLELVADAPMVAGGRVDYRAVFEMMMEHWVKENAAKYGATVTAAWTGVFAQWPIWMSGEHVVAVRGPAGAINVQALWDTADGAKVEAAAIEYLRAMVLAGDPAAAKPKRGTYRGVRHTAIQISEPGPTRRAFEADLYLAAPGATFALSGGGDSVAGMRALIDTVTPRKGRKPVVPPGLAAVLTAARAHGDSYVWAMDLPAVSAMKDPSLKVPVSREHAALTFGFGGGAIVMRATLPAAQLAAVVP